MPVARLFRIVMTATALADTLFRFGPGGGANIIQNAINAVAPGSVKVDGGMGPQTIAIFARLASDPATLWQLLDAIGNERDLTLDGMEKDRTDHFRFLRK
jgi:lysozyme family protein